MRGDLLKQHVYGGEIYFLWTTRFFPIEVCERIFKARRWYAMWRKRMNLELRLCGFFLGICHSERFNDTFWYYWTPVGEYIVELPRKGEKDKESVIQLDYYISSKKDSHSRRRFFY
jgi:hypothetical protein